MASAARGVASLARLLTCEPFESDDAQKTAAGTEATATLELVSEDGIGSTRGRDGAAIDLSPRSLTTGTDARRAQTPPMLGHNQN